MSNITIILEPRYVLNPPQADIYINDEKLAVCKFTETNIPVTFDFEINLLDKNTIAINRYSKTNRDTLISGEKTISDQTLHIETTKRCTLECPACARTVWKTFSHTPVPNTDLDYTLLYNFLDCEKGKTVKSFSLCGDYGDTIYYPQLFDFIKDFRQYKFSIYTNGSYRNKEWWTELNSILLPNDTVVFAIDGIGQKQNELYRKNCNWESIMVGINTLKNGPSQLRVDTLNFSFNVDHRDEIEEFANNHNMVWKNKKTHRFGDDSLRPEDKHVQIEEDFKAEYHKNVSIPITPQCDHSRILTSDGNFLPCDWMRNPLTYYSSDLYKEPHWVERLDIRKCNLDEALEIIEEWKAQVIEKGLLGTCSTLCKMKCRSSYGKIT